MLSTYFKILQFKYAQIYKYIHTYIYTYYIRMADQTHTCDQFIDTYIHKAQANEKIV